MPTCRVYGDQQRVPFSLHARAETVNQKMIDQLAAAGCRHIAYGVESGSERIRREVMKRPVTNEKLIQVFGWTKQAGILATANYMMGVPGQTRQDMQQTLDLHERLEPDDFGYFVFYPYPGTPLFGLCRREGYLPENYLDLPANHKESILTLPRLTQGDIAAFYDRWTKVRVAHTLKRSGPDATAADQQQAVDLIEQCAAQG